MKRIYLITVLSAAFVVLAAFAAKSLLLPENKTKRIKVGFVHIDDASAAYTGNFMKAETAISRQYGDQVEILSKFNVPEGNEALALQELVEEGCRLVIATSYGYGESTKEFAKAYPEVQFCQATCANANQDPVLENYHTFMGEIYQGRYVSGVVAGMKLRELLEEGRITKEQAKVGYVAAFPYAEVISGYTAFILGVRSVVPEAVMTVVYTDTWSSYALEKKVAEELIKDGCVIISQHSDTTGPAAACENTEKSVVVYHVGYNQSMTSVAPTTHLTGCKINWAPYILSAVEAVLKDKKIEDCVDGNIHGNDAGAGFEKGWVEMLKVNEIAVAHGTGQKIQELIQQFNQGEVKVFQGDYTGTDPFDETDTCDLKEEYVENETSSAPTFHYVLDHVITIKE